MWAFFRDGFVSIVAIRRGDHRYRGLRFPEGNADVTMVQVRARAREHLERVIDLYRQEFPDRETPRIQSIPHHDYQHRIVLPRDEMAILTARLVREIDYDNFKGACSASAAHAEQGRAYVGLLHEVWSVMARLPGVIQSRRARRRR